MTVILLSPPDIACPCLHVPIHCLIPIQYALPEAVLDQRGRKGSEHRGKFSHQHKTLSYFIYFLWIIKLVSRKVINDIKNLLLTYRVLHGYSSSYLTDCYSPWIPLQNLSLCKTSCWNACRRTLTFITGKSVWIGVACTSCPFSWCSSTCVSHILTLLTMSH